MLKEQRNPLSIFFYFIYHSPFIFISPSNTSHHDKMLPRVTKLSILALSALATLGSFSHGFYLPGVAPKEYHDLSPVDLNVNALTPSSESELKSIIAYDYYDPRFNFCKPPKENGEPKAQAESLGSILFGDRIFASPFKVCFLTLFIMLYRLCRARQAKKLTDI